MPDKHLQMQSTAPSAFQVVLNGQPVIATTTNLFEFCQSHFDIGKPCVVLLNGRLVKKANWQNETLAAGDLLDVFSAIAGG